MALHGLGDVPAAPDDADAEDAQALFVGVVVEQGYGDVRRHRVPKERSDDLGTGVARAEHEDAGSAVTGRPPQPVKPQPPPVADAAHQDKRKQARSSRDAQGQQPG